MALRDAASIITRKNAASQCPILILHVGEYRVILTQSLQRDTCLSFITKRVDSQMDFSWKHSNEYSKPAQ